MKSVTCFFAEVAISIAPPGCASTRSPAGFTRFHLLCAIVFALNILLLVLENKAVVENLIPTFTTCLLMSNSKVHQIKDNKNITKRYRIIPYNDLVPLLKKGDSAFLEDDQDEPLNRGTVWKAARRLSELVGQKVVASRVIYTVKEISLEGYLFEAEAQEFPSH